MLFSICSSNDNISDSRDDGLTSFMERSSSYGLSDFIEDSNNYYDDYDSDYLSYGGHDDSSYFIDN